MKYGCPNQNCNFYKKREFIVRDGSFWRSSDSKKIQRLRCKSCGRRFSNATFSLAKGQKKRRVNPHIRKLLSSGVSIRRIAVILEVNQKTVARKLKVLALISKNRQARRIRLLKREVRKVQFDDLITTEHTKLKPLSISLAVESDSRKILAVEVSQIPAFGHLV